MYKYLLWGAEILSDIPLDITDQTLKRRLVEVKVQVDRTGAVTDLFLLKEGKIRAFPDDKKVFNSFIQDEGKHSFVDFYEEDFPVDYLDPITRQAKKLDELIRTGQISEFELDKLTSNGLDPEVIRVWEKVYRHPNE